MERSMRYVLLSLLLFLSACSTSYQSAGLLGGYTDDELSPGIFQVNFRGNGFTSATKAKDFTLLRSAEVVLNRGYSHFVIIEKDNQTQTSAYTSPGYSTTDLKRKDFGKYEAETNYYGGSTTYTTLPSYSYTVKAFRSAPPESRGLAYDARFLKRKLRLKYELDESSES